MKYRYFDCELKIIRALGITLVLKSLRPICNICLPIKVTRTGLRGQLAMSSSTLNLSKGPTLEIYA